MIEYVWKEEERYGPNLDTDEPPSVVLRAYGAGGDNDQTGFRFFVKWDGCTEISDPIPDLDGETQSFHICSVDYFIDAMIQLRDQGRKIWGEDWGK